MNMNNFVKSIIVKFFIVSLVFILCFKGFKIEINLTSFYVGFFTALSFSIVEIFLPVKIKKGGN